MAGQNDKIPDNSVIKIQLVETLAKVEAQKNIADHTHAMMSQLQSSMDRFISKLTLLLAVVGVLIGLVGGYQIYTQGNAIEKAVNSADEAEKLRESKFKELVGSDGVRSARIENPLGKTDILYANPDISINSIGERSISVQVRLRIQTQITFQGSTRIKLNSLRIQPDEQLVSNFYASKNGRQREILAAGTYITMDSATIVSGVPSSQSFYIGENVKSCEDAKAQIASLIALKDLGEMVITPIFEVGTQPKADQSFKIEVLDDPVTQDCNTLMGQTMSGQNNTTSGNSGEPAGK